MNDSIQLFQFQGSEIRFVGTPDAPEWVASDVCAVLGLNTSLVVNGRPDRPNSGLDDDEKGIAIVNTLGGEQKLLTVTEPGLYNLIIKSKKPEAKPFKRWVFHEVLPSIRKTGSYSITQQPQPVAYLPTPEQRLNVIERGVTLLDRLGGLDDRTRLALKDLTRNILLEDKLKPPALPSGERLEWPVSDRLLHLGYKRADSKTLKVIGQVASKLYQSRHGKKPPKREQFVDGTTRPVNCYGSADLDILDEAINRVMGRVLEVRN